MSESRPAVKQRKKASSACLSCRARRTKCNVEPGQILCSYCHRNNLQCVFQDDDERKGSASKARISELNGRIEMLEGMLKAHVQPLASQPQGQSQAATSSEANPDAENTCPERPVTEEHRFQEPDFRSSQRHAANRPMASMDATPDSSRHSVFSVAPSNHSTPNSVISTNTSKPVVAHLEETVGSLGGGTAGAGCSSARVAATLSSDAREQRRQTDRLLEDVPPETDAYLISLFFQYGNSMLPIVDKEAFLYDKARGSSKSYSGFLHIVLLAMGLRYADHSRPDVARYILPNRENTLHKGARYLVEYELQCYGGIPSIQALLLLGDLEAACGKDNTGWMYGGMAIRLCFDMRLNLPPKPDLPEWELRNWRSALWACYIHDRYWSFYLGRPTSMKRTDMIASRLAHEDKTLEDQIFSALITLMDLVTEITDNVENANKAIDEASYVFMTGLYQKLNIWYTGLPLALQWNATNIDTAPSSYFLLHQQYHSSLILLHRPLAQYNNTLLHQSHVMYHLALVSRIICFDNAMKVAQIFARLRIRFDIRKVYFSAVQHAGTASTALINGLSQIEDPNERVEPLKHLHALYKALHDMSSVYQPADRMSTVLSNSFIVARWSTKQCPSGQDERQRQSSVPPRPPSKRPPPIENIPVSELPSKRRRDDEMNGGDLRQQTEITYPQQFDPNMRISHTQPQLGIPLDKFGDGEHIDAGVDFVFRTDLRDLDWEGMTHLSPLQPRRANFLDMTSGFDQLFQTEAGGVIVVDDPISFTCSKRQPMRLSPRIYSPVSSCTARLAIRSHDTLRLNYRGRRASKGCLLHIGDTDDTGTDEEVSYPPRPKPQTNIAISAPSNKMPSLRSVTAL